MLNDCKSVGGANAVVLKSFVDCHKDELKRFPMFCSFCDRLLTMVKTV
jgi:hypothetical protein